MTKKTHHEVAREYWLSDEQYEAICQQYRDATGQIVNETNMSYWTLPHRELVRMFPNCRVHDEGNIRVVVG